jgi:hypothetical protein
VYDLIASHGDIDDMVYFAILMQGMLSAEWFDNGIFILTSSELTFAVCCFFRHSCCKSF